MSSIIFYTNATEALVATDTLAVDLEGKPVQFCSKSTYLPHLRTIIVGTGVGGFANDWANDINNDFVVSGIRNLNFHTPTALRKRWERISQQPGFSSELTTTIYQIGVCEETEEICSYAYRSENNFESEVLNHALRVKPKCKIFDDVDILTALKPMMEEQRRIQEQISKNERLYIGGQCIVMYLTKDSCTTTTLFSFDEYNEQLKIILNPV